jgi:hypothetical protein
MRVYVNDEEIHVLPGMQVRHALLRAGMFKEASAGRKVFDDQGHEMGLGGALREDMRIYVK